jgi:hypothetical protein
LKSPHLSASAEASAIVDASPVGIQAAAAGAGAYVVEMAPQANGNAAGNAARPGRQPARKRAAIIEGSS